MSTITFVYDSLQVMYVQSLTQFAVWVMYAMVLQISINLECRLTFNLKQCDSPKCLKIFAESNIKFRYIP